MLGLNLQQVLPENVTLMYYDPTGGDWVPVDANYWSLQQYLEVRLDHFSIYALVGPTPVEGGGWLELLLFLIGIAAGACVGIYLLVSRRRAKTKSRTIPKDIT